VKSVDLTFAKERLSGRFVLDNGQRCPALGFVTASEGRVKRFELIVKGMTDGTAGRGSGFPSIGGGLVPAGQKTAAAVAFMLADPNDELAKVQPGSSRDLRGGQEKETATSLAAP